MPHHPDRARLVDIDAIIAKRRERAPADDARREAARKEFVRQMQADREALASERQQRGRRFRRERRGVIGRSIE